MLTEKEIIIRYDSFDPFKDSQKRNRSITAIKKSCAFNVYYLPDNELFYKVCSTKE